MRERVLELLPLLLVAAVLIGFQLTRSSTLPALRLQPTPTQVGVPTPLATATAVRATTPVCRPGQPRFVDRLALLRAAVGSAMGDPVECEHVVDAEGNIQQQTTTGLAYVRKRRGLPSFTTGWEHWALRADGQLVAWSGDAVDPPE